MKQLSFTILILLLMTMCSSKSKEPIVVIQTNFGNIKVKLYNETPGHRDNFLKLVENGHYKDVIFHRVIRNFMIQGGDSPASAEVEEETIGDTIPAEINFPKLYHKRGVLAAARWGDAENPNRASDATQFYIVTGKKMYDDKLNEIEKNRFERLKQRIYKNIQAAGMDTLKALLKSGDSIAASELRKGWLAEAEAQAKNRESEILYTPEQREVYSTIGGTPHLDNEYTVFGEVIEGMDVVDMIQEARTNTQDRPLQNIFMSIVILEK